MLLNAWAGRGTVSTTFTNASSLARRGHDVEVISVIRAHDDLRFPIDAQVRLTPLVDLRGRLGKRRRLAAREPSADVPVDENRYNRFSQLTDVAIREFLAGVDSGVVVGTRPALNIALAEHTSPKVIRVGQEHLFLDVHADKPAQLAAMRVHYPALDVLVSLTSDDARDYAEQFDIRTTAIPNGVRLSGSPAIPETLRDSRTIIAAGRLSGQKGFERLVEAMAIVGHQNGWRAKIFGAGGQEDALRELIDRTGAPVDLMGFSADLAGELRRAAIFTMTSRFEGFPMVMLEAMGAGLPVVTFAFRTGCEDLMTHEATGLVAPQDDVPALAQALKELMASPERRIAMGAACYEVARSYTPELMADRWEALFERLVASRTGMRGLAGRLRRPRGGYVEG